MQESFIDFIVVNDIIKIVAILEKIYGSVPGRLRARSPLLGSRRAILYLDVYMERSLTMELFLWLWRECFHASDPYWMIALWLFCSLISMIIMTICGGPCSPHGDSLERSYFKLLLVTGPFGTVAAIYTAVSLACSELFVSRRNIKNHLRDHKKRIKEPPIPYGSLGC